MKTKTSLPFILIGLLISYSIVFAVESTEKKTGFSFSPVSAPVIIEVKDEGGQPIENVLVTLGKVKDELRYGKQLTNKEGIVRYENIPINAACVATASAEGYQKATSKFTMGTDTKTVSLVLKKKK